jgi:hypothetical protein
MQRDYLIDRMKRTNANVLNCVACLPFSLDLDKDQQTMIEEIEYILLQAYEKIDDKIAEYALKSA